VSPGGTTLDLGAGYCHFINEIRSRHKIALDINEHTIRRYAAPDVRCIVATSSMIPELASESVDTVFASNVYEHFPSREDVATSFQEVHRVLRAGGRFMILQPNFAHCSRTYYDFFDHRLAFTHKGMVEGLTISGFTVERCVSRFLPYTTKSRLPTHPALVAAYLRVPLAWRILGAQMLIVVAKS
jgi:SAM-dependent methyltransferase